MKYIAMWNMPACLPEMDPQEFVSFKEAQEFILDELENVLDDIAYSPGNLDAPARLRRAIIFTKEQYAPFMVQNICGYTYSVDKV